MVKLQKYKTLSILNNFCSKCRTKSNLIFHNDGRAKYGTLEASKQVSNVHLSIF